MKEKHFFVEDDITARKDLEKDKYLIVKTINKEEAERILKRLGKKKMSIGEFIKKYGKDRVVLV